MRYFVISDIHSFYNELINSLNDAGFDRNNPEHTLVVAGDLFDRGPDTILVYEYLSSLEKEGRVRLICGNHESLYLELLDKYIPSYHDYTNGTVDTFVQIAGHDFKSVSGWRKISKAVSRSPITEFVRRINSMSILIGSYLICHSVPNDYWENPYLQPRCDGLTIVFGHWDVNEGSKYTEGYVRNGIFYGNGLIGLDSGFYVKEGKIFKNKMGVLVIDI